MSERAFRKKVYKSIKIIQSQITMTKNYLNLLQKEITEHITKVRGNEGPDTDYI